MIIFFISLLIHSPLMITYHSPLRYSLFFTYDEHPRPSFVPVLMKQLYTLFTMKHMMSCDPLCSNQEILYLTRRGTDATQVLVFFATGGMQTHATLIMMPSCAPWP